MGALAPFVKIRPVELDDAPAMSEAILESKAELAPWLPRILDRATIDGQREWVAEQIRAHAERTAFECSILDAREDTFLGLCGINHINHDPGFANLGYWVRTSRRGEGIVPVAVHLVARFTFEELGLHRLEVVIDVDNAASIRVAEKVGAVFECVMRNRTGISGKPRPARMYSLVPEDLAGRP